jgi:hypothetical protein
MPSRQAPLLNATQLGPLLLIALVAGCSNDSTTRNFSLSRDSGPQTVAATRVPLSTPPSLAVRPARPGAIVPARGDTQSTEQTAGSTGQDALLEAAGPVASSDIRTEINQHSGLVYPDPAFVDQVLNWSPTPGYAPMITQAPPGGWFSRIF